MRDSRPGLPSPHGLPGRLHGPLSLALIIMLSLIPAAAGQTPPIEVTGATRVEIDEGTGIWHLTGAPVTVRRGAMLLRAPVITYYTREQRAEARGGVTYADSGAELSSAEATVWLADERLVATGTVNGVLKTEQGETRLRADRLEAWRKEQRMTATGAVMLSRADMTVTGERIDYDEARRQAVATGRPTVMASGATLTADRIDAALDSEEMTATGHAQLKKDDIEAAAPNAVVRNREGIATLTGGVVVRRGEMRATAPTVVVNLKTNTVTATGGATLTIPPPPP